MPLTIISGVAGVTGSIVAKNLLLQGHHVVGADNFFSGSQSAVKSLQANKNFYFFEIDICDSEAVNAMFHDAMKITNNDQVDCFVNCAAVVHTKHFYYPEDTFAVNVIGMRNALQSAIRYGTLTFINCSTSEVYSMNSWSIDGVRESEPVLLATAEQSQRTSYAAGKLLTEFFLREAVERGRIRGCSVRFSNVYSPDEVHTDHIIPHIIASLLEGNRVILLENAKVTHRTFLHSRDSAAAVVHLINVPEALDGSVYNAGATEEIQIVDLVQKIADLMGLPSYDIEFFGTRSADPIRRRLNCEKLAQKTGWKPRVQLEQGLNECIQAATRWQP